LVSEICALASWPLLNLACLEAVAPGFHGLGFGDGVAALRVHLMEILQHVGRIHAALAQLLFHQRQVVANKVEIKHES
jgi:hypothetical protein